MCEHKHLNVLTRASCMNPGDPPSTREGGGEKKNTIYQGGRVASNQKAEESFLRCKVT